MGAVEAARRRRWATRDRAVCARCGLVMHDEEPMGAHPQFTHRTKPGSPCPNDFAGADAYGSEFLPFKRKGQRRAQRRGARSAAKFRPR